MSDEIDYEGLWMQARAERDAARAELARYRVALESIAYFANNGLRDIARAALDASNPTEERR